MDKPEQNDPQNDPFYQLMKDSKLHLDSPELEEDILRQLRQLPQSPRSSQPSLSPQSSHPAYSPQSSHPVYSPQSPHPAYSRPSPHNRPSTTTSRLAILFLSIAVIWGLALTALYATHNSPSPLPDPALSLFLPAMLVLTFLFLLEKIIQLLMSGPERRL
jgi:hypothetical protein